MNREQRRVAAQSQQRLANAAAAQLQAASQQGPVFNVGPLVATDGLLCLIAAHCPGPPEEAIDRACHLLAEAQYALAAGKLGRICNEAQQRAVKEVKASKPLEPSTILIPGE